MKRIREILYALWMLTLITVTMALFGAPAEAGATSGTYKKNGHTVEIQVTGRSTGNVKVRARQPDGEWGREVIGTPDTSDPCASCGESPDFVDGNGTRYRVRRGNLQMQARDGNWWVLRQATSDC